MNKFEDWTFGIISTGWFAYHRPEQGNDIYLFSDNETNEYRRRNDAYEACIIGKSLKEAQEFVKNYLREKNGSKMNFIKSNSGVYSGVYEGKAFTIGPDHANYRTLVECFQKKEYTDFWTLANPAKAVEKYVGNGVVVEGDVVYYNGEEIKNSVVNKIFDFMDNQLPVEPLVKFLENLMQNPSMASRDELYDFLDYGCFPITEDGCFLAYKGLRGDYRDCHSGKFLNSIGTIIEMERHDVDDDRRKACSYGFHVGTYDYANSFQRGKLVMVKVNPKDVVSVPHDCACQKCRVCKYEVLQDCEVKFDCALVEKNESGHYDVYEEDDFEDYTCDVCNEDLDYCSCEQLV